MPIDPEKAVGQSLGSVEAAYEKDDVILYHLGLGAGAAATDPRELEYTYEKNLKVLPSYAVVAGSRRPLGGTRRGFNEIPGLSFNLAMLLHGEQDVEIHQPLPTQARITSESRIANIYDKGKAALVIMEGETRDDSGEPLFTTRMSLFVRGEGGFGGDSGPKAGNQRPDRKPDGEVESKTLPQQALLYRLNGDKNPLHADPEFAKLGSFDKPIIHGLCSYGIVCKAVVDDALDGDTTRVARYQARFAGVAFPGETYRTSWWREGDTILIEARAVERDAIIISNAAISVRS